MAKTIQLTGWRRAGGHDGRRPMMTYCTQNKAKEKNRNTRPYAACHLLPIQTSPMRRSPQKKHNLPPFHRNTNIGCLLSRGKKHVIVSEGQRQLDAGWSHAASVQCRSNLIRVDRAEIKLPRTNSPNREKIKIKKENKRRGSDRESERKCSGSPTPTTHTCRRDRDSLNNKTNVDILK